MTSLEDGGQWPLRIPSSVEHPLSPAPLRRSAPPEGSGAPQPAGEHSSSSASASASLPSPPSAMAEQATAPLGAPHRRPVPRTTAPGRTSDGATGRRGWRDLDTRLLGVLGRLTERDRVICRLLDAHRVLTADQVAEVCFTRGRRARMRLGELVALEVLDRFRPRGTGRPVAFHYVLGPLGS